MPDGSYGVRPSWKPASAGDRLLVTLLTANYLACWLPMRLLNLGLGWCKVDWVMLDLLSVPGAVFRAAGTPFGGRGRAWGLKANALEHTFLVCRLCPPRRRALRDPTGGGQCAWNQRWNQGDFGIPPHFGGANWVRQYYTQTELGDYEQLAQAPDRRATAPTRSP